MAAVKATVDKTVGNKVAEAKPAVAVASTSKKVGSAVKGSSKKVAGKNLSSSSETSAILAPPTAVRQSSRKRTAKSYDSGYFDYLWQGWAIFPVWFCISKPQSLKGHAVFAPWLIEASIAIFPDYYSWNLNNRN